MTVTLTKADRARITKAIEQAELKTDGEILCVVARAASDYRSIPLLWAALLVLPLPWLLWVFTDWRMSYVFAWQPIAFILLSIILSISNLRFWLVPRRVKRRRAIEAARAQFFLRGLYKTSAGTGVLLFVSLAERYVEILSDEAVSEKIGRAEWRRIIETIVPKIEGESLASALETGIHEAGLLLQKHVPISENTKNEIPNRVVLLENASIG